MARPKTVLIAPLMRDCVKFDTITNKADIKLLNFDKNPEFTAKKYFMPAYEPLYTYDRKKQKIISGAEKMSATQVLFGMRLCDLNAVKIQDELFLREPHPDSHYKERRDNTIIIGYYCDTIPSEWCFCSSMKLTNYYDLMFRDKGKYWYIDIGSERGKKFILPLAKKLKLKEEMEEIPAIKTKKRLKTHDIDWMYNHPKWKETVDNECLSCERCTLLCPTCMCFHMYDNVTDELDLGQKKRTWESCHNVKFTRVAGDHFFRGGREERFKHRIWHKIKYYPDVFGKIPMCTGCGRCIEHCPTLIDWVEIINNIHDGKLDDKKEKETSEGDK